MNLLQTSLVLLLVTTPAISSAQSPFTDLLADGMKKSAVNAFNQRDKGHLHQSATPPGQFRAELKGTILTKNYTPKGIEIRYVDVELQCINRETALLLRFRGLHEGSEMFGSSKSLAVRWWRGGDEAEWTQVMERSKYQAAAWVVSRDPRFIGAMLAGPWLKGAIYDIDGKPLLFEFDTRQVEQTLAAGDFFCKQDWLASFKAFGPSPTLRDKETH